MVLPFEGMILNYFVTMNSVHICVTLQHVDVVDQFLKDLKASVEYVSDFNLYVLCLPLTHHKRLLQLDWQSS